MNNAQRLDRVADILKNIDARCQTGDVVTLTKDEITTEELQEIYELTQGRGPQFELEEIEIFVCSTNTDLTEGKGHQFPYAYTMSETVAKRLVHKKGVQGTDAQYEREKVYRRRYRVYAPVRLTEADQKDLEADVKLSNFRIALQKAKDAGLSDDDIKLLARGAS